MSLLRFVARTMFAGHFILDGVKAVTRPAESAPDAEAFASKVTPLIQRVVPADMSSYVPEKAETWVRIAGVAQIAGGAMFATGFGRRIGALLLAKASVLNVAMALPGRNATVEAREAARPGVLLNVSLLGASVLGILDTQGSRASPGARRTPRSSRGRRPRNSARTSRNRPGRASPGPRRRRRNSPAGPSVRPAGSPRRSTPQPRDRGSPSPCPCPRRRTGQRPRIEVGDQPGPRARRPRRRPVAADRRARITRLEPHDRCAPRARCRDRTPR
ncbi:DoxX family membrane protein [Tessaracoccus sp. HDW20]|nr:DoxX family membrane protein [Tessaracoccus coleopterorum]